MKMPRRSAALARASSVAPADLPEDFAARVARLAEARRVTRHPGWSDIALLGAFLAMIGACVAGWLTFVSGDGFGVEWLAPIPGALGAQPWLVIGLAGLGIVRALTFGRRTAI